MRLAVEEGGRPVGVEDPGQDRVFGRLQELRTHGFEEGALSEMKMETLLDITCRCHFCAVNIQQLLVETKRKIHHFKLHMSSLLGLLAKIKV